MSGSNSLPIAVTSGEATRRWRERGARLDANIQRNMRLVMSMLVAVLTLFVIWAGMY